LSCLRFFGHHRAQDIRDFTPRLRGLLALNLSVAAAGAMVIVNTVVVVRGLLGGTDGDVAIALACFGGGSMAAALVLPRLLDRVADRRVMLPPTGALGATLLCFASIVFALGWDCSASRLIWPALLVTGTLLGVGFDLTNHAALARCSDGIERILDELFNGVAAAEEIVPRPVSSVGEMRDFLISDEGQVNGHADENDVDSIILKLQAALDILAGRRLSLSEVEEKLSPTVPTRELHIREISADDLERALSRSDIEIVCSSNTPIADPIESDNPPMLRTLERPLPPGEVSLDELERAFREKEVEPKPSAPAPLEEISPPPEPDERIASSKQAAVEKHATSAKGSKAAAPVQPIHLAELGSGQIAST
jgi:hypothetical protein